MGRNMANELASNDFGTFLDTETAIGIHLSYNHYPPIPSIMITPCIEAIDAVNDLGLWDLEIPLPEGVLWKGLTTAPAHAIIEQHHLHEWLIEREY